MSLGLDLFAGGGYFFFLTSYRPREAAFEIVHLVNSRNQNVALLALSVRDFLESVQIGAGLTT